MFELDQFFLPVDISSADPIEILGLPIRIENTLKLHRIGTVGEFLNYPFEKIQKFKNFGIKSVKFLEKVKESIRPSLFEKKVNSETSVDKTNDNKGRIYNEISTLKGLLIENLLESIKDIRSVDILKRRYGLGTGEKETLEEIGSDYNITRERVRQIQKKTIRKIQHPSLKGRGEVIALAEEMMLKNGVIISDSEADNLVPKYFNNSTYDGSSFLDLLSDVGWIQNCRIGDVTLYAPKEVIPKIKISYITDKIYSLIKNADSLLPSEFIVNHFEHLFGEVRSFININQLVLRLCHLDPRIEEKLPNQLGLYTSHPRVKDWRNQISDILIHEGTPLHFTEITEKINSYLCTFGDKKMEVRRVHSILIESTEFSHSGIRGTYGLSKWGLRKERTPVLIEECLKKSGVPLNWKQIYNYVKKYKDTKEGNILSILNNNKNFIKHGRGEYILKNK